MCGRYTLKKKWSEIHQAYREFLDADGTMDEEAWTGRVNVPPATKVPVLRRIDGHGQLDLMRWGLIPSWAVDEKIGYSTFNARADSFASKVTFRAAWKAGRRCIIPADSFFEWRKTDKQPFAVALGNRSLMSFAGLWEEWTPNGKPPLLSCTIITTEANKLMASLHDRMPVILGDEQLEMWLDPETKPEHAQTMLRPFQAERLQAWPVSKDVGNVKNQAAELIEPLSLKAQA